MSLIRKTYPLFVLAPFKPEKNILIRQQLRVLSLCISVIAENLEFYEKFFEGELVKESANIHTESQNDGTVRLKIDYLKPEDAGIYNLIVSNNLGESIQSAKVSIQNKPKKPDFLEDLPSLVKVVEGFPIKLSVQAVGYPQPSIQW